MSRSLDQRREPSTARRLEGSALSPPAVIGLIDAAKRQTRRAATASLAGLDRHGVDVRCLALARQPDFDGVELLVAALPDVIAAAECSVRHRIPLLIASDDELVSLAGDLDHLAVTLHAVFTVKLDSRGERLVVGDCVIEPENPGVLQVEIDRATAIRRKLVLATADPLDLRNDAPTFSDPGIELTIDQDDLGPARLPTRSLVVVRSSRTGDRLVVSCDGGIYRGVAHEVKIHSAERLPLVSRDCAVPG